MHVIQTVYHGIDLDDYCSLLRITNPQQCSITTCMHMNYGLYDYYLFGFYMKNKKTCSVNASVEKICHNFLKCLD